MKVSPKHVATISLAVLASILPGLFNFIPAAYLPFYHVGVVFITSLYHLLQEA